MLNVSGILLYVWQRLRMCKADWSLIGVWHQIWGTREEQVEFKKLGKAKVAASQGAHTLLPPSRPNKISFLSSAREK